MTTINELALFAGAGGGILASQLLGHRIVCAVEAEPYRREVLLRRQRDGLLPLFPIWDDIRTFDGNEWRGTVDLVSAGFPCQPFSVAGKQHGELDERNLWPDTARIIREVRPRLAFLENVPGLLADQYFGTVLGDLAACGYDAEWTVLGADDCGAPHRRKRLWILAHSNQTRPQGRLRSILRERRNQRTTRQSCSCGNYGPWCHDPADVENSEQQRRQPRWTEQRGDEESTGSCGGLGRSSPGLAFPTMGRVAHGVAHRVDRLAALGDGQVPIVAATAFKLLKERFEEDDQ